MAKLTLMPTQRGLLEVLLKHQRRRVIQLARPFPSVPLHSCQASGNYHRCAGLPLWALVRRFNLPRTTAKLPVLRSAKAGAGVARARATRK
jgi:hypothetical protein